MRGNLSTNDGEIAVNWALAGHGIVLRAEWDIARYLRSGRLRQVLENWQAPPADIHAVYPVRHQGTARVRAFVDHLARISRSSLRPRLRARSRRLSARSRVGSYSTRIARKSLTLVWVGPVTTRSPSALEVAVGIVARQEGVDLHALRGGALQRVGRDEGAGVVFHAVDAVGVGRQRPHAGLPLQRLRQPQAELAGPAAAAARRALAAACAP